MLHVRRFGSGPEVVALHGFSLTGEQFAASADLLDRTIIAPDLAGHGLSASEPTDVASVTAAVCDVAGAAAEPLPVIGYSQGGRLGLLAALHDRSPISALILISATAGVRGSRARQARSTQDADRAARIEQQGIGSFIAEWTTTGLTSLSHLSVEYRAWDLSVRQENTASGLASALVGYGQGAQPVVWSRLDEVSIPTLVIAGRMDDAYVAIAREMARRIPDAQLEIIEEAGHNPLADQPAVIHAMISRFLDRHG